MTSPSTYRVKLSFKSDRLVMPVERIDGNVFDAILTPATLRFRAQRLLSKEDSFIQVSTADGYIIDRNDLVKDVIERNDQLVLVNRDTWIQDFKQNTQLAYWFGLSEYDHKVPATRAISVAYAASKSAICITSKKGDQVLCMEVFDRDVLTSYGKDGLVRVMHEEGVVDGSSFVQSAHFKVVKNRVVAVQLSLKTLNCPQTKIVEHPLNIGETELTHGEAVVIQKNWPPAPEKKYELPPATRTGTLLTEETEAPLRDLVNDPNVSTGTSRLIFTQTSQMIPEKYNATQTTYQHLRVELSATNNDEMSVTITNVVAEYQARDGNWHKFKTVMRGYRQNDYSWSVREEASPMRIESRDVVKFALGATLELPVQKALSTRLHCIDNSLPVPLNVRFTFTDQDGKTATLLVTRSNRGTATPTLASAQKDRPNTKEYIYVDDLTIGERLGASYVCGPGEHHVRIFPDSSYYSVDSKQIHDYTIAALKEKTPELKITEYTYGNYKASIHLLVDLESRYAYGVRFRLSTPDGSVDESFLLPKENW